jgi:site-specific DNA-cytosine methylase
MDRSGKHDMDHLRGRAIWGTPLANDAKNSLTDSERGRGTLIAHIVESHRRTPAGGYGHLNADWAERLMGYPAGWTDIDAGDIDTSSKYPAAWKDGSWDTIPRTTVKQAHKVQRIKGLGNAIVPQIATWLWKLIKEKIRRLDA